MPRNQTRANRRTRQVKQPAAIVQDDSVEESSSVGRNKRSTRNLSVSYSDSSRRVSGAHPERVTRSRTRASRNEPEEPSRAPLDSDDEDSFSEPEVSPKKKARLSLRRGSPKKKAKSSPANQANKAGRRKRKVGRKSRKQTSEEDESEESLDLGESEDEAEERENEEEEDEVERVKPETASTPRRGSRSGTRSTTTPPATPNVSNKSSPSVVLQRMDNAPTNVARTTRGRSAAKQRKVATAEPQREDDTAGQAGLSTAANTSSSRLRGRRSARQSRQQPAKKGKMVPSEENAAVTTDTANKEDGGDKEKAEEKEKSDEEDGGKQKEDIPEKKEAGAEDEGSTSADTSASPTGKPADASAEGKKEGDDQTSAVEKMDVDEPPGPDTAAATAETKKDEVLKKTDVTEETKTDSESSGKHKLDVDEEKAPESAPLQKKAKVEEEKEKTEPIKDTAETVAEKEKDKTPEKEAASKDDASKKTEEKPPVAAAGDDNAVNGEKAAKESKPAPSVEPKVNGSAADDVSLINSDPDNDIFFASLGISVSRQCVTNPHLSDNVGKDLFSVVSYNLSEGDWSAKHQNLVNEVLQLSPSILCMQEIDEVYFKRSLDSALKSHGYIGLYKAGKMAAKGLATFYLLSSFEVLHHREIEVHDLLEKDIQQTNLLDAEKEALKSFLNSPAPVLITKLKSVSNGKTITVGTVSLPSEDEVVLAVQVAAVMRELLDISEGPNNPHVLCGSFSLNEDSVVQHLLRDGLLKNEILEDLKKKANVPVPDKENAALATLLETSFKHPSVSLKSSYESVLGHELKFPDKTQKLSRDSVWFSSSSLLTKNVLDVGWIHKQVPTNVHISLKVELGFVN